MNENQLYNEKLVYESRYKSILPILLIILGALTTIVGFVVLVEEAIPGILLTGIAIIIVGVVLNAGAEIHLVVTTKRVYCDGPYNNFVNLPLEHISSVSMIGNALHIASASGRIVIPGAADRATICNKIAALLNGADVSASAAPSFNGGAASPSGLKKQAPSVPANDGWTCTCGQVNPKYMSTCPCGKSAREVREMKN